MLKNNIQYSTNKNDFSEVKNYFIIATKDNIEFSQKGLIVKSV